MGVEIMMEQKKRPQTQATALLEATRSHQLNACQGTCSSRE